MSGRNPFFSACGAQANGKEFRPLSQTETRNSIPVVFCSLTVISLPHQTQQPPFHNCPQPSPHTLDPLYPE